MDIQRQPKRGLLHILCACIFIMISMLSLYFTSTEPILWIVGGGCIASSITIIFISPTTESSSPRNISISYTIALVSCLMVRLTTELLGIQVGSQEPTIIVLVIIALFITLYIFSTYNINHPPAAGLTLVLVAHDTSYYKFIAIIILGGLLSIISHFINKKIKLDPH